MYRMDCVVLGINRILLTISCLGTFFATQILHFSGAILQTLFPESENTIFRMFFFSLNMHFFWDFRPGLTVSIVLSNNTVFSFTLLTGSFNKQCKTYLVLVLVFSFAFFFMTLVLHSGSWKLVIVVVYSVTL